MRLSRFILAGVLWATIAAAGEPPGKDAPVPQILAELRRIESAQYRGKADAMRLAYQEQVRSRPNEPLLRVYVAWCSMVSDDAWNQLRSVMTLEQDYPWAHWGMGRVYVAWKMKDPARAEFEAALKKAPGFWPAQVGLADVLRMKGDDAEAAALYRQVLKSTDDAEARSGLGRALLKLGKKDEARQELKKAIALWPDQPKVLSALLSLAVEAKDPAALGVAEKLAELTPKEREVRKQLADLRFAAGQKAEAAKDYERLNRLGNAGAQVAERLVGLYRDLGDAEAEERTLGLLVSLDTARVPPLVRLAELKAAKKDVEGELGYLLEALTRDPKHAGVLLKLADLKAAQGPLYESLDHLRAAAAIEGPQAEEAKARAQALEKQFELPKRQASGAVNSISWRVAKTLGELYEKRRWKHKLKAGLLRIRVKVTAAGAVEAVDVLSDELEDPILTGHAVFCLKDATYPKAKREPVFEFELGEKKKGK